MASRGVFRGLSSVLFDDPDYQRLSIHARLLLVTLRLCRDAGPAAIFEYSADRLMRQTGLSRPALDASFHTLEAAQWVEREPPIVWIRNGLKYDPLVRLADPRHKAAIVRSISLLPRFQIVLNFCDYYELVGPFPRVLPGPTHRVPEGSSLREKGEGSREKGIGSSTDTHVLDPLSGSPEREPDHASLRQQAVQILDFLNQHAHKSFRPSDTNLALIEARLRSGMTPVNLRGIIVRKVREWRADPTMAKFLRPATLFRPLNAEQYLGEREPES